MPGAPYLIRYNDYYVVRISSHPFLSQLFGYCTNFCPNFCFRRLKHRHLLACQRDIGFVQDAVPLEHGPRSAESMYAEEGKARQRTAAEGVRGGVSLVAKGREAIKGRSRDKAAKETGAMIYPEAERGRGKKDKATKDRETQGFSNGV